MARSITAATLILLCAAACGGRRIDLRSGNVLSYAQYHSLETGMTADAVINAFGAPANTLEQDGSIRGLTYRCRNAAGRVQELRMAFDGGGRLERWALRGPDGTGTIRDEGAPLDTD